MAKKFSVLDDEIVAKNTETERLLLSWAKDGRVKKTAAHTFKVSPKWRLSLALRERR